jgi:hypothetical protein
MPPPSSGSALLIICFMLVSCLANFNHEDGGDIFLWNLGWLSTDYTMYIPEDRTLKNHCCENLRSHERINILPEINLLISFLLFFIHKSYNKSNCEENITREFSASSTLQLVISRAWAHIIWLLYSSWCYHRSWWRIHRYCEKYWPVFVIHKSRRTFHCVWISAKEKLLKFLRSYPRMYCTTCLFHIGYK